MNAKTKTNKKHSGSDTYRALDEVENEGKRIRRNVNLIEGSAALFCGVCSQSVFIVHGLRTPDEHGQQK